MTKHRHIVTVIRRSCITNKLVWVYRGVSREAGRQAYYRACKKELEKARHWMERMADRKRRLTMILGIPENSGPPGTGHSGNIFGGELTDEQRRAARELVKLSKQEQPPHSEFYNHIIEERRRHSVDRDIRRKMRERDQNTTASGKDSVTRKIYDNRRYDK